MFTRQIKSATCSAIASLNATISYVVYPCSVLLSIGDGKWWFVWPEFDTPETVVVSSLYIVAFPSTDHNLLVFLTSFYSGGVVVLFVVRVLPLCSLLFRCLLIDRSVSSVVGEFDHDPLQRCLFLSDN